MTDWSKHTPTAQEIETASGLYLDVASPNPEMIQVDDIAHALSNICRYGGHCSPFYSVAEHAVFVSKRLERKGHSKETQLAGLHHDDAEAYLGDIPRPIKPLLGKPYERMTNKVDAAIFAALDLPLTDDDPLHDPIIKEADNWALLVEARHLLPSKGLYWDSHAEGKTWTAGQPDRIITPDYWRGGLQPEEAEALYLERHFDLCDSLD